MPNKSSRSLGRPLPDAQRPRNPFDRSYRVSFNQKAGHLLPIAQLWAPAGSHVKINRSEFIRTFDIATSSFVPFDHFIDFFAVKLSDLWSYWDNWYLNINDMHSSFANAMQAYQSQNVGVDDQVKMRTQCPAFSMFTILHLLDGLLDEPAGTGELSYTLPEGTQVSEDETISNVIRKFNARRLLNVLHYPVTVAGTLDSDGKYLGMTPDNYGYVSDQSNQLNNLFPLLAYQKIYFENYRNNSYQAQNPFYYNMDWLGMDNTGVVDQSNLEKFIAAITQLRSVNYRKDFFQSAYPALDYVPVDDSPLQWDIPSNVVNAFGYYDNLLNGQTGSDRDRWSPVGVSAVVAGQNLQTSLTADNKNGVSVGVTSYPYVHTHAVTSLQDLSPKAYNVQAIRAAFALDKLKRASAYAPRHIKDQYEARFGFKFKGDEHHSIRLGSFKCNITPYEVTQTAPGQSAGGSYQPLGTIGGKGVGSSGYQDEIDFDCQNCDYIILGISYFIPRVSYDSLRFDPFVTKFALNHFFQPEFENLGLQPVYQKLISWSTLTNPQLADVANNILRYYQTRYQEYKTGIDVNLGLFNRDCMLSPFTSHLNLDKRVFGTSGLDWRFFKVLPDDVDNMFVSQADPSELTDQFYGVCEFVFKCTQLMSVHGQPSL